MAQAEQHITEAWDQPLAGDDELREVESRYTRALARLAPELATICQLISMSDDVRLNGPAVAAALNLPVAQTTSALEALVDTHFLEAGTGDTYYFHEFNKAMIRRHSLREDIFACGRIAA